MEKKRIELRKLLAETENGIEKSRSRSASQELQSGRGDSKDRYYRNRRKEDRYNNEERMEYDIRNRGYFETNRKSGWPRGRFRGSDRGRYRNGRSDSRNRYSDDDNDRYQRNGNRFDHNEEQDRDIYDKENKRRNFRNEDRDRKRYDGHRDEDRQSCVSNKEQDREIYNRRHDENRQRERFCGNERINNFEADKIGFQNTAVLGNHEPKNWMEEARGYKCAEYDNYNIRNSRVLDRGKSMDRTRGRSRERQPENRDNGNYFVDFCDTENSEDFYENPMMCDDSPYFDEGCVGINKDFSNNFENRNYDRYKSNYFSNENLSSRNTDNYFSKPVCSFDNVYSNNKNSDFKAFTHKNYFEEPHKNFIDTQDRYVSDYEGRNNHVYNNFRIKGDNFDTSNKFRNNCFEDKNSHDFNYGSFRKNGNNFDTLNEFQNNCFESENSDDFIYGSFRKNGDNFDTSNEFRNNYYEGKNSHYVYDNFRKNCNHFDTSNAFRKNCFEGKNSRDFNYGSFTKNGNNFDTSNKFRNNCYEDKKEHDFNYRQRSNENFENMDCL